MKLNDYQEKSKRTLPKFDDRATQKLNLANYSMGLAGETGELVDMLKKSLFHGHEWNYPAMISEAGDVLNYLTGLCTMLGLELEDVARANIEKLEKRYPNGFSQEDSINRKA